MGRPDTGAIDPDSRARRVRLRSVPLHEGYDPGGAYWGERRPGEMLFCAWSRDFVRFMDARSYLLVEEMIRRQFPNAEFCG
jgi:hypothetical protein